MPQFVRQVSVEEGVQRERPAYLREVEGFPIIANVNQTTIARFNKLCPSAQ
jgi:hypothetical protein